MTDVEPLTKPSFTAATALAAEGARIGFVSCVTCGAAILIDPRDAQDNMTIHRSWHDQASE